MLVRYILCIHLYNICKLKTNTLYRKKLIIAFKTLIFSKLTDHQYTSIHVFTSHSNSSRTVDVWANSSVFQTFNSVFEIRQQPKDLTSSNYQYISIGLTSSSKTRWIGPMLQHSCILLINVVLRCCVSNVHQHHDRLGKLMTASGLINLVLSFIYLGKMSKMKKKSS